MDNRKTHVAKERHHAWKARFAIGICMLFLAVVGMIVTDMKVGGAWIYWRVMTPIYALLSIGLSLYMRHMKLRAAILTIWHEILHWIGLVLSIYLISSLIEMGFISRFQAGVEVLLLLALATFLAGVYIEPTFIIVGVAIGLLVIGIGFLDQYLYAIVVPVLVIAVILLFFLTRRKKPKPIDTF